MRRKRRRKRRSRSSQTVMTHTLISALESQRQAELCVFKASLVYRANFRIATRRHTVSEKKTDCNTFRLMIRISSIETIYSS